MDARTAISSYVEALNSSDVDAVLALFADGAVVSSPLRKELPAPEFYGDLDATTTRSNADILDVFHGERPATAAALLRYDWTLANGARSVFECVDVFEFDEAGRFIRLRIYYDPRDVRDEFEAVRGADAG